MGKWTAKDIPSQVGKRAIVTGATDGIGLEIARELAKAGAHVILAADHAIKGARAVIELQDQNPGVPIEFELLDTSDLNSVEDFAHRVRQRYHSLDLLILNAGVAGLKDRKESAQRYELTFATNYLGHFALTGQLLAMLMHSQSPRVICQSSLAHENAEIFFEDLQRKTNYDASEAYGQSKLAMLLFARELNRRARAQGTRLISMPVHPGGVRTNIFRHGAEIGGGTSVKDLWMRAVIQLLGQSPAMGALPALYAATAPAAVGGEYYGPGGLGEMRGYPKRAKIAPAGQDGEAATRLWKISEQLTGVKYSFRIRREERKRRNAS